MALPHDQRPIDHTPVHTVDLPDTPQRDRRIPASAWTEAPPSLLAAAEGLVAGDTVGDEASTELVISYLRRIGPWLLWRAGPAVGADARYWAALAENLDRHQTFRLFPDGTGKGIGPSGEDHSRFRTWKEDLRDHP